MNAQYLDQARAAYRAGDYSAAVQMFNAAKDPSEINGEADHLRGNALMKLGLYRDAAISYTQALNDASYGRRGALLTNQGKAYAAAGDYADAQASFTEALRDASYATPYKAYLGLGQALLAQGSVSEAGTAFRQAAIDGANPAPAGALAQLASCFIQLGRPGDAVESYRTALDFAGPRDDTRAINAGLGQALLAANRPADAVDAFTTATADGIYQLTPEQQNDFARAQDALAEVSARTSMAPAVGAPDAVDPLDPLGKSGAFMPDPSDTGFFTLSESELIQQDRQNAKVRRKKRHLGLKVFLVIFILLLLAAGGLGFAYTRGLGFPSQQDAITGLFQAVADGEDPSSYLDSNLSDSARSLLVSSLPEGGVPTITNMDQSMTESTALLDVEMPMGATLQYEASFTRADNHIGWVVSDVQMVSDVETTVDGTSSSTDGSSNADATDGSSGTSTDGSGQADAEADAA